MSEKSKEISRKFLIVDIVAIFLMQIAYFCPLLIVDNTAIKTDIIIAIVFTSSIDIVISIIFTVTAIFLARRVKNETGMKQNNFLISWHIANSVVLALLTLLLCIKILKFVSLNCQDNWEKILDDHSALTSIMLWNYYHIYIDTFLLWLLYRFMKPSISLKDGKKELSALLFASNSKTT